MIKIRNRYMYKNGYTILEAVIYFSMLAVLTTVVTSSLISLFRSYSVVKLQQDVEISAIQVMDKLTRDIRSADSVVAIQSSFDVPQGAIALNITNNEVVDTYVYFATSSAVKMSKNGMSLGDLTQPGVIVNSFIVRYINGTSTQAIKIEMNLQAVPRYGTLIINKNFYTTVQLRN